MQLCSVLEVIVPGHSIDPSTITSDDQIYLLLFAPVCPSMGNQCFGPYIYVQTKSNRHVSEHVSSFKSNASQTGGAS